MTFWVRYLVEWGRWWLEEIEDTCDLLEGKP